MRKGVSDCILRVVAMLSLNCLGILGLIFMENFLKNNDNTGISTKSLIKS